METAPATAASICWVRFIDAASRTVWLSAPRLQAATRRPSGARRGTRPYGLDSRRLLMLLGAGGRPGPPDEEEFESCRAAVEAAMGEARAHGGTGIPFPPPLLLWLWWLLPFRLCLLLLLCSKEGKELGDGDGDGDGDSEFGDEANEEGEEDRRVDVGRDRACPVDE